MKLLFVLLGVIVMLIVLVLLFGNLKEVERKLNNIPSCKQGDVNQQQCLAGEYYECPPFNGSYAQCTNNYNPKYNTWKCDCHTPVYEVCPLKINNKMAYETKGRCEPSDPMRPIHQDNGQGTGKICKYPRVNYWNSCDFKKNYNFMIQCKNCKRPYVDG